MIFVVHNRDQLIAAINAAAQPTRTEALTQPTAIRLGTTIYRFPRGLTEARAKVICRAIKRTRQGAFRV